MEMSSNGTLSRDEFDDALKNMVEICRQRCSPEWRWTLVKHEYGIYATMVTALEWKGETVVRHCHITFNETYGVPVLWFNFYRRSGELFRIDDILDIISPLHRPAILSNSLTSISQNEHPHLGYAFYHLHPCRTNLVMKDIMYENYILSWLSVYGSAINFPVPNHLFVKDSK
ncbi:hypothetical protein AB6A40_008562 [Gnathostoma spinigerum]|uniref:Ubiquitin-like-conjugating enzyme ATG10 n=1 Tax=Gnathostoma spinigerum TaxID=75299 RepID=A0ABD6EXQ1_9BILA